MLRNNIEIDVKVKCMEEGVTQVQLAEKVGTSAPYLNRLIKNSEGVTEVQTFYIDEDEIEEILKPYEK